MTGIFEPPVRILPDVVLQFDLLRAFIWYIGIYFVVSLLLRLRIYVSVYRIVRHVQDECPHIFELIYKHWFLIVKNGLILMLGIYMVLVGGYMGCNQFLWPLAHVGIAKLAGLHQSVLVFELVLIGVMLCVDSVLMAQIVVIDVNRVKSDLTWAESWLGGRINRTLGELGKKWSFISRWNPIRHYADVQVRETMVWLNEMFRGSIASMIAQLLIRVTVAASLFSCYVLSV